MNRFCLRCDVQLYPIVPPNLFAETGMCLTCELILATDETFGSSTSPIERSKLLFLDPLGRSPDDIRPGEFLPADVEEFGL